MSRSIVLALLFLPIVTFAEQPAVAAEPGHGGGLSPRIVLVMDDGVPLADCLMASGLACERGKAPVPALKRSAGGIVIVEAVPDNLKALADAGKDVESFTQAGGWLVLCGLFPDALADFNRIVGVEHVIRQFAMEEVDLGQPVDPLLKGLTSSDVFLESGEWTPEPDAVPLRAKDMFTYVVDHDDIAPFCQIPGTDYWKEEGSQIGADHWPQNMVNGLTYHWRFGFSVLLDKQQPRQWPVVLPRKEKVVGFSIAPGALYHKITEVTLGFEDGKDPVVLTIDPTNTRQDFTFPARDAERMTVEITKWDASGSANVVAVNNIWIKVARDQQFYRRVKPLLSVGGLVRYSMGKGGVILNQLHIRETETNPVNADKKRKIAHTLIKNLSDAVLTTTTTGS